MYICVLSHCTYVIIVSVFDLVVFTVRLSLDVLSTQFSPDLKRLVVTLLTCVHCVIVLGIVVLLTESIMK